MKIYSENARNCRKAPEAWFTGDVWVDEVVATTVPSKLKANRVTFAPAARTAWHTHPVGQALHIVSGVGLVQLKGEPIQELHSGDSVWIEANELHWHGAAPGHTFIHLALQEMDDRGIDVVWLDHVTDEEYSAR